IDQTGGWDELVNKVKLLEARPHAGKRHKFKAVMFLAVCTRSAGAVACVGRFFGGAVCYLFGNAVCGFAPSWRIAYIPAATIAQELGPAAVLQHLYPIIDKLLRKPVRNLAGSGVIVLRRLADSSPRVGPNP